MIRLSIIIPVFNVQDYVARCIESCLNQDLPQEEYEIIVIDDGSSDDSLKIVNEIASQHSNIRVMTQENNGLSITRNRGLSLSNGTYVWFVDSDDEIEYNCLSRLLREAEDMDVVAFGYKEFNEEGSGTECKSYGLRSKVLSGLQFIVKVKADFMHGAPFYLFRRKFLTDNSLSFYPGIFHEDSEFTPRVLSLAQSIYVSKGTYYHRTMRADSITHNVNKKRAYDMVIVAKRLYDYIKRLNLSCAEQKYMLMLVPRMINGALNVISKDTKLNIIEFNIFFSNQKLYAFYLCSRNLRYFIEGVLLFMFRKHPVDFYLFVKR